MHFVKDLFTDNETEHLHNKFIRYSRGNFIGPLLKVKIAKANIKVYASFHYVDELLEFIAEYLGDKEVNVKGVLLWNKDLGPDLSSIGVDYVKLSKARGIFKYTLDTNVALNKFVAKLNQYNLLVNIKEDNLSYATKSSFPKPNKEFKADFCKLTLPIELKDKLLGEFCFDVENTDKVKTIEIENQIVVDDIKLPEGESDFNIARRMAKRVGNLSRTVVVDGVETKTEKAFNV